MSGPISSWSICHRDPTPPSLEVLTRAHRQTPSHANLIRLAQGLYDAGKYSEANQRFSEILADDSNDKDAVFGYAKSCLALDERDAAIRAFEHLVELAIDYRDYAVAFELAQAYWNADRKDECISLLDRVCRHTQRLEPRIELATYLRAQKCYPQARETLLAGLDSFADTPAYVRRRQRVHAWKAKRMLRDMPSS